MVYGLQEIPSGINVVPLKMNIDGYEQEGDLVAGVTGYNIGHNVTDPESRRSYPVVKTAHGWGVFMNKEQESVLERICCFH